MVNVTNVLINDEVTVHVTMTAVIQIGKMYRINSSYGYAGLESGVVQVRDILPDASAGTLQDYDNDTEIMVRSHIDAEVSMLEGKEHIDRLTELYEKPWVQLVYSDVRATDPIIVIPLELFIDHMSIV